MTVTQTTPATAADPAPRPGTGRRRRRMRRLGLLLVAAAAVAGVTAFALARTDAARPPSNPIPPATAEVVRTTLVDSHKVSGTLGYGKATELTGRLDGTVTALAATGSTVERGQTLYTVDNRPVVLMYGSTPMYRTLATGSKGPDVHQLEENLRALGFTGFTVDDTFNASTATAVRAWQKKQGLEQTGRVDLGRVVFLPGAVRIADHKTQLGGAASGPVLTYTGTGRQVTVDLQASRRQVARVGSVVTITLPDRRTVSGTVAAVATTAKPSEDGKSEATVEVTITVTDRQALDVFDQAPVEVAFVAEERKDVLAVPVAALLALREGGYGVQVVDGASTRIVPVEIGMFSGGKVEIRGDGITAGTKVGVPQS